MEAKSKCGKCGAEGFEPNLEPTANGVHFWFVRCKSCRTVAAILPAESATAMLHDVLKLLKEQDEKISAIIESIEVDAKK